MINVTPRPCPFCNEPPSIEYTNSPPYVKCKNPECRVSPSTYFESSWVRAVMIWNNDPSFPLDTDDLDPLGYYHGNTRNG